MASDVKFTVKDAISKQYLTPAVVSDEIRDEFLKKCRSSSWKLLPVSIIVSAIVIAVMCLLIYFLKLFVFSALGLFCIFFPAFAVYNIFATAKAIKKEDYEFLWGEVVGKTDSGYKIRGLEEHNAHPLIGKKEYNPGDRVIVGRLNDDLNLISES